MIICHNKVAGGLGPLSETVFLCEVVRANACQTPVDEGFLESRWFARWEISDLEIRQGTWGDKKELIWNHY